MIPQANQDKPQGRSVWLVEWQGTAGWACCYCVADSWFGARDLGVAVLQAPSRTAVSCTRLPDDVQEAAYQQLRRLPWLQQVRIGSLVVPGAKV